ncbi:kinase D-interacting substrate of 220 kDa-like [Limulus polyphemus]|uniref:Kinase D-interacting substrate of 220 kDa-like n=1 Tax=Limulus polyphemus TaxID=6850 RepID=A0ABM1SM40_LIMPO|nr:kinase D-interacting substrate of 220 kDa-like [Limulus polyphemus]
MFRRMSLYAVRRSSMPRMTNASFTALSSLVTEGNVAVLHSFLESKRCNPDERDEIGQTLLMLACQTGQMCVIQELLRQGADINAEDYDNWTPLLNAAKEGYVDIVTELVECGADIHHRDMGGWTALMWTSYKGHTEIARFLLDHCAMPNIYDQNHISCLVWAAGRGHTQIVRDLINHGAKVNSGDKNGTTPLVWACRKGYLEIVDQLLEAGANPDTAGMHATRAGHFPVVDALLKKYADTDVQGTDKKTAFYWAVEKGYVDIVRIILAANPNLEIPTKDGDTPLMKATRNRNIEIVQMLVDKKAKVSTQDRKGDTALHIAMRARSKAIVEILLRNPKNSQLLYRPNRSGETPYNIDTSHQKCILSQIFGARRLNTNEDSENMLGYDLYSSALADILSEPSLSMPISVGLYARWGSGKSFLLDKLEDEMRSFCVQWLESVYEFSWLVFLVVIFIATTMGLITMLTTSLWSVGLSVGAGICVSSYIVLAMVKYGSLQYEWNWACKASLYLGTKLNSLSTLLKVVFCHPPTGRTDKNTSCVRFLFTDQTKVSASAGDTSVANIVSSLFSAIEDEFGFLTTRLYRVFRPKPVSSQTWKWRRLCCIPYFVIFLAILGCIVAAVILLITTEVNGEVEPEMDEMDENVDELDDDITKTSYVPKLYMGSKPIIIALACVVGLAIISNLQMLVRLVISLFVSHQRRIHHNLHRGSGDNNEGRLSILKSEVETMTTLVKCLDGFVEQQTRLVVIFDGLDSCEQEKVLRVLDAVHLLFSDVNAPFVVILAIDPHIIVKAIESNIHRIFRNSNIRGPDYLRNIVHLPFYLQNSGLRRVRAAQQTAAITAKRSTSYWNEEKECDRAATTMVSCFETVTGYINVNTMCW